MPGLGRRVAYTYEIVELAPAERTVMRTVLGPFPMVDFRSLAFAHAA